MKVAEPQVTVQNHTGPDHQKLVPRGRSNVEVTKKRRSMTGFPFPCHPNFRQCWGGLNPAGASRPQSRGHLQQPVPMIRRIRCSGIACVSPWESVPAQGTWDSPGMSFLFHFCVMSPSLVFTWRGIPECSLTLCPHPTYPSLQSRAVV